MNKCYLERLGSFYAGGSQPEIDPESIGAWKIKIEVVGHHNELVTVENFYNSKVSDV